MAEVLAKNNRPYTVRLHRLQHGYGGQLIKLEIEPQVRGTPAAISELAAK